MANALEREGPTTETKVRCSGCRHLKSEAYHVQGDSGRDYWCEHPVMAPKPMSEKYVGDCKTDTPAWCPVRKTAQ